MSDNLQFRVSAELKNILGRDLITSPDIAILELVKNSYDANASKVEITFNDDYLAIADNGKGMSKSDLIDKWLFVAYSAKSDGTEERSYRDKFKRHYAGAKGIGRMSCDRLAKNMVLTTRSADENKTEVLHIDWSTFEHKKRTEFDTISIPHETLETIPMFPQSSLTGTILEFTGLHISWTRETIIRLKKSLEKLINPFSGTDDDFQIEIIAPQMKKDDDLAGSRHDVVNGVIENSIADVLKLKTTEIESHIKDGVIHTKLADRGVVMYEIEESNQDFSLLSSVSISLFFLNRAAKYNFTSQMGIEPVNYGNVFLFRNGFRILPFGEYNDDSWGLNQRQQQGYNRRIGTRDLFGRVDVETDNPELIKEVSSRDGGLIKTDASQQLMDYFSLIHRRLERYVVGVLWGEGFIRKEYFINQSAALDARKQLESDKDSDTAKHLYKNIGSKVDFLQLVKSLVNDKSINIIRYNEELADIVSNPSETEVIQAQMFDDVKKLAEKTNDDLLLNKIQEFEKYLDDLRFQKEEAERKETEARKLAEESKKWAEEEENKRRAEEEKRKEKEKELEAQKQKNLYLNATRNTTQEVQDITHAISIASTEQLSILSNISSAIRNNARMEDLIPFIHELVFFANKVKQLSMLITKADIVSLKTKVRVDLKQYIEEYLANFKESLKITIHRNIQGPIWKRMSLLDIAIVLDNLISNSKKNNATTLVVNFFDLNNSFQVVVSDDGDGVDLSVFTKDSLFDEGVTNKRGGSGIGLHTIRYTMEHRLNGHVEFLGNNLFGVKGASFKLTFE